VEKGGKVAKVTLRNKGTDIKETWVVYALYKA
jgi:hypothetical protein